MLKKFLLTIVLLFSIGLFSQTIKYVNIEQNNWLRIVQYNDNQFTIDKDQFYTSYPSYIITKTTDYTTQNGYLHRVWITSNTQINNLIRNVQIDKPNILFWNGNQWVSSFYLEWIVVGNVATQVHYFFYNYPVVQVQMKWTTIKIK